MSLHRCAACGSPNVVTDIQTDGVSYNYKKGIVGTVVLGAGGAVAGVESSSQQVYKCPDCGITLTYPMPVEIKNAIDAGVCSAAARDRLTLYGVAAPWSYFTQKYSNIESGSADEELRAQEKANATLKDINTKTMRVVADSILKDYQTVQIELAVLEQPQSNIDELQVAWEEKARGFLDARKREYEQSKKAALDTTQRLIAEEEQKAQSKIDELTKACALLTSEKAKLEIELSSLGLFKGKRKKEITERLQAIENTLYANQSSINQTKLSIDRIRDTHMQKMYDTLAARQIEIDKKYPLPESPFDRKQKLLQIKSYLDGIKNAKHMDKVKATRRIAVYKYIEFWSSNKEIYIGFTTGNIQTEKDGNFILRHLDDVVEVYRMLVEKLSEIVNVDANALAGFADQTVALTLRELTNDGKLCIEEKQGRRYYYIPR